MEISATKSRLPAFHLIVVAGGSGVRAGGGVPKQYRLLGGRPLICHSVQTISSFFDLRSLVLVIGPAHEEYFADPELAAARKVIGGTSRAESVANGLAALQAREDDIVLIHDAARPFVAPADIAALLEAMGNAATLAAPVSDTLMRSDGDYVDREGLWAVQTPQAFRYGLIRRAHAARIVGQAATDDTALVAALGEQITIVPGRRGNFKVTTAEDWALAESMIQRIPRTGIGFDVHAFDPARPGPVRLGGVDIPHDRALLGHSDADAGLHALTDALLGAIGDGDIGQHFPPSDPAWKNADSAAFLADAIRRVSAMGGIVSNLDLTIICEAPKIGPYRAQMQQRIADICSLLPSQIGIKATTSEQLGFTGRREGIAAQAVATVMVPQTGNVF